MKRFKLFSPSYNIFHEFLSIKLIWECFPLLWNFENPCVRQTKGHWAKWRGSNVGKQNWRRWSNVWPTHACLLGRLPISVAILSRLISVEGARAPNPTFGYVSGNNCKCGRFRSRSDCSHLLRATMNAWIKLLFICHWVNLRQEGK